MLMEAVKEIQALQVQEVYCGTFLGTWIRGFAFNIGYCSSVRAELFTTLMGLEIAWSMGIEKLILESDSTITVNALTQDRDRIDANHDFIVIAK